ncbi:MAG: GNAT family N-acetyltransferase [Acidobacteriota bacterium]|nr:GNAT family N-acetyltransferase [Acidobacteriota bacterium]
MSSATEIPSIIIRDIEQISEMREIEALQKEVWGSDDRDIVPLTIFAATREVGAILIGAFDGASLIGFACSFVGREDGRMVHHSHMLAVRPIYRNFNLGYRLKLAQRDRALAQGITQMTWTFDPLQSLNAHFNFAKLDSTYTRGFLKEYAKTQAESLKTPRSPTLEQVRTGPANETNEDEIPT